MSICSIFTAVNSLLDLANQREIKYGTLDNSAVVTYFESQMSDPYKTMYKFMMEEETFAKTSKQAFQWINESYGKPKGEVSVKLSCFLIT